MIGCRVVLQPGSTSTLLDALCARYPALPRDVWVERFGAGHVCDASGASIRADEPFRSAREIHYYRVFSEEHIPVVESVVHADARLLVADKPHFLPVIPAGKYRAQTLVARLIGRTGNPDLSPLHRIDRNTAGLVLFSTDKSTRATYQALFRERRITKRYEALAGPLPELEFPLLRATRLQRHADGFRMEEVAGEPNTLTRIEVIDRKGPWWRYALYPHSGKMHQLRVHMAAMGAPIANDLWYPCAASAAADDYERPLKLLAHSLDFIDPVDGTPRSFSTRLHL